MSETWIMVTITAGVLGWSLGGTFNKAWRRIAWPIVAATAVLMSGLDVQAGLLFAVLVGVNSLPYGDRTPWPVKIAVFLALAAPGLVVNPTVWPFTLLGGCLITALAIGTRKLNYFTHKLFEAGAGLVQAGIIVLASLK